MSQLGPGPTNSPSRAPGTTSIRGCTGRMLYRMRIHTQSWFRGASGKSDSALGTWLSPCTALYGPQVAAVEICQAELKAEAVGWAKRLDRTILAPVRKTDVSWADSCCIMQIPLCYGHLAFRNVLVKFVHPGIAPWEGLSCQAWILEVVELFAMLRISEDRLCLCRSHRSNQEPLRLLNPGLHVEVRRFVGILGDLKLRYLRQGVSDAPHDSEPLSIQSPETLLLE